MVQQVSPYDEQGRLVCHAHNVLAVSRTSHTVGNMNRDFYTCPRRAQEGPDNCRFFYWKDQLPPPPETGPARPHTPPAALMETPSSRLKPDPSHQSPFLPSPYSPTKRGSPFENGEEAKRKRLKTIKDALSRSGAADRALPSNSKVLNAPESPTRISHDKDQVMSTPPSSMPRYYKLSSLGLDVARSRSSTILDDEEDEVWRDLSPSSSAEKVAISLLRSQDNVKGKRRAVELAPEDDDDDAQFWQDAPVVAASQGNLFRQRSPSPKEGSTTASPVTETSDLPGDNIERFVCSTVNGLTEVLDYVRMLERKLAATEKSNAYKAKRIKELEAERLESPQAGWSSRR
ncbi:transcriptional regulator family: Zinc finger, GRF-type [Agaricus bisporus var. burnettii]|uniref:Transcriptional regulator family: Zinc finger, GRF-type n=1 Tax=Agaricus bisporus var. burnettii TaxID=192524 RepID=A0A8H7KK51_AGABI|nr:transcriptional regulator family: Zinc finger, GRF-type [Agaricus bisporus var. burnettii]